MLLMCSLLFLFVPSVPRVPYVPSAFPIIPSVSVECVPDCVRCSLCGLHCSQCSLLNPVCSLLFPVFPIFPPLCPDCSWCSEWVTCGRPPAAGPTLSTQKQSVLLTLSPVPSVFPIVSCVPSVFHFSLFSQCVPSVFPIVYSVPSSYCSQYVSSVSPLWSPLFVVYIPSVYVPCVFPMFPVRSLKSLFKGKLCSQCVTSVISTVRDVPSVYPIFPYCSQYVSSVFPIVSGVPSVISIVPSVPYWSQCCWRVPSCSPCVSLLFTVCSTPLENGG